MKETLHNWVTGCSVCSWVACACSKCKQSRKEVVVWFQICAILKHHNSMFVSCNSIHHSHRIPVPSTFHNPCIFASSWFSLGSFLLLREFHKLQGKINLFFSKSFVHQRLIREVFTIWSFCDAWCLNGIFYHIAAGTNLKNETTKSNNMSRTWHKWTETSHFTQSKVTISPTHSNEISRSNETSRCTRWPFRELSTMTYCGHARINWTELLHSHSDPLQSQRI